MYNTEDVKKNSETMNTVISLKCLDFNTSYDRKKLEHECPIPRMLIVNLFLSRAPYIPSFQQFCLLSGVRYSHCSYFQGLVQIYYNYDTYPCVGNCVMTPEK